MNTSRPAWFLAQIKPNSAKIAKTNLQRQGFSVFLPTEEKTEQRRGRFASVLRPMFPGYIFVALDAAQGHWRAVNSTYGITRLVSFGNRPAPVPDALVAELQARCDESGKLLPPGQFSPGDRVRVMSGPFSGFLSEVESMASEQRVWLLMDIMGAATKVGVDCAQLQPA